VLHGAAGRILEREGALSLRLVRDFMFLNDARLRLEMSSFGAFSMLTEALRRHGIGAIEVQPDVDREEWIPFVTLLLRTPLEAPPDPETRCKHFVDALAETPVARIAVEAEQVEAAAGQELDEDEHSNTEAAKRTYFQSVQVVRGVLSDVRLGRAVNARRIKHSVQGLVNQVLTNETSLLGMTTLRDYDEYTFTHSVNVCILSLIIGRRLDLTKNQLYWLGLGALLHDIGKTRIDPAITTKEGALTAEELAEIRRHPLLGLLAFFSIRGFGDVPYRAMLMAYEHHMNVDLSGYPPNKRPRSPTIFSRIVAVADRFDAATSKRSYQWLPKPPDEVIKDMRDTPNSGLDPLVVKALINVTGIYPVGTVVILDTGELAIVAAPHTDPKRLHQPIVKIISDPSGRWLERPVRAFLSEQDPATGRAKRAIVKTTDPDRYGVRTGEYFV
jgi:HD-GYP domain-containing protein (c-di-GMP phosphodiesterase class II)